MPESNQTVHIPVKTQPKGLTFILDEILWADTDQETCYQRVAEPTVRDALKGYNGTIFAFGQTGR